MRNERIDALKGFAIILVIIGHSIGVAYPLNSQHFQSDYLWNILYSFHMPLFGFLSGYVVLNKTLDIRFIKRRFISLMLPYIAWLCIGYFIFHSKEGPWFLITLFLCCCIFAVSSIPKKDALLVAIAVMIGLTGFYLPLRNLAWLYPFFVIGYLVAKHEPAIMKFKKTGIIGSMMTYPTMLILVWPMMDHGTRWWYAYVPHPSVIRFGGRYFCAFAAILLLYYLFNNVKSLAWLGKRTLGIYVTHGMFLGLYVGHGYAAIATSALSALFFGLVLTLALERTWLSLPLLGKPLVKNKILLETVQ